ncbi:SEC14-like protein 5, partial [Orchesella cincta]
MGATDNNDEITTRERELIIQLRERVQNELPLVELSKSEEDQDLFLVRWIRARDNNLDKATDMLRNSLNWRKEHSADELSKIEIHPFFVKNYPYKWAKTDKFGHPVMIVPLSEWDYRKIGDESNLQKEYENFLIQFYEDIMNHIKMAHGSREIGNPPITQLLIIMDATSYPFGQLFSISAFKKIVQSAVVYEAHYPEILFKAIFIKCPSYFGTVLNVMKPFLPAKTFGKFFCYSSMEEWKKDMIDLVDPAILPQRYGGTSSEVE